MAKKEVEHTKGYNLAVKHKNYPEQKIRDLEKINDLLSKRINRLDTIFEVIQDGIILLDIDGSILFFNQTAKDILNSEPEKTPPEEWPKTYGFFLEDHSTLFPAKRFPLIRALNGEPVSSEEFILSHSESGQPRWVSMTAYPWKDTKDNISGAILVLRDISKRKKLEISREKHAMQSEALYSFSRSIAQAGDDLDQICNLVATLTTKYIGEMSIVSLVNQDKNKLVNIACYHPDSKIRVRLNENLVSEEVDLTHGIIKGVIDSKEALLIPSLESHQLADISSPLHGDIIREIGFSSLLIIPIIGRGEILGTISLSKGDGAGSFSSDDQALVTEIADRTGIAIEQSFLVNSLREEVSSRISAEQALSDSEIRFQSIFELTSLGIKIMDLDGNILQTNQAFQEMIGYSNEEISNQKFTNFLHPQDKRIVESNLKRLVSGEIKGYGVVHRLQHADGHTVWANTSFTAVVHEPKSNIPVFVFGIAEDITKQKQLELEMREMKIRLQENIENERIRLAQDIHDGPMQILYSAIYQIEGLHKHMQPENVESLESIRFEIQKVINELRATTQELRPPTLSDFGLEKAIRSHAENISQNHPELQIQLFLARDQQVLPENIRFALFRIYQSCITNIFRHAEASNVEIRFTYDLEEIILQVSDDGKGFTLPNRWIEFTREGHYGLAGIAERIEALDGELIVESEPGSGTMVKVVIPSSVIEI